MDRKGIVAAGNLLMDKTALISSYPSERMLTNITDVELHCGGGCTNTLFNLRKLEPEMPLYICGAVGNDSYGRRIVSECENRHIDTSGVCIREGCTSFTDVFINQTSGDRTFFHYPGVMDDFATEHVQAKQCKAKIMHFAYLPLLKRFLDEDERQQTNALKLFRGLNQQGIKISLDLVSVSEAEVALIEKLLALLPYIDYLIINDEEARQLCKQADLKEEDFFLHAAKHLLSLGVRDTVIIHFPDGAVGASTQETLFQGAYLVKQEHIVSTLGAGDAFCAGALLAIHEGLPLDKVLKYGNALAHFNLYSISSTDGAVERATLNRFIADQERQRDKADNIYC